MYPFSPLNTTCLSEGSWTMLLHQPHHYPWNKDWNSVSRTSFTNIHVVIQFQPPVKCFELVLISFGLIFCWLVHIQCLDVKMFPVHPLWRPWRVLNFNASVFTVMLFKLHWASVQACHGNAFGVRSGKQRRRKKADYLQSVALDFKLLGVGPELGTFGSRVQRSDHSTKLPRC